MSGGLPPGCTDADIDRAAPGYDEPPFYCEGFISRNGVMFHCADLGLGQCSTCGAVLEEECEGAMSEHTKEQWAAHKNLPKKESPHTCSDPTCPGNINRQKLELWGELVEALAIMITEADLFEVDTATAERVGSNAALLQAMDMARSLLTRAATIPAQGGESG